MATGDVGRRIREARDSFGEGTMRIADLARRLGVDHGRLSNWERGKHDPPYDFVVKAADILDVNVEWLLGEPIPMRDPSKRNLRPVYRTGTKWIPVYGAIAAGTPAHNTGDAIDWYEMREWLTEFERWGRIIEGFSMEPNLMAGDMAIFENRQWEPGHVVHAYDAGEDTVKQVRRIGGKIKLCPTNPDYDMIDGEGWNIKGVCIAYVRREDDGSTTLREYPNGMRPKGAG